MASSRPVIGKSRSISAAQSPDHPQWPGRRTPRSPAACSPENQQRNRLVRSISDVSKTSKSHEQTSGATAVTKRQPVTKLTERPSPCPQATTAQTTVKERVPRTSPVAVSRLTSSVKQVVEKASTSRVASKTMTTTQPVSKTKSAAGLAKKKAVSSTKSAVVVSENGNNDKFPKFEVIKQFAAENGSELPVDDTSFIAEDVDEELNHVNESEENKASIHKSKNAIETTSVETSEENKIKLGLNSEVIGYVEDNEDMVEPTTETTLTINGAVTTVDNDAIDEAPTTLAVAKKSEIVPGTRTESPKINEVIEETRNKLLEHRKSRVKALVGAFETVMS